MAAFVIPGEAILIIDGAVVSGLVALGVAVYRLAQRVARLETKHERDH